MLSIKFLPQMIIALVQYFDLRIQKQKPLPRFIKDNLLYNASEACLFPNEY